DPREERARLLVERVFVTQAALEPAADALRGVGREREALDLRHAQRHRLEDAQEGRAAERAPADARAAARARALAGAELAELDARLRLRLEVARELAQVDAILGRVVDEEALAREELLRADDPHGEALGSRALLGEGAGLLARELGGARLLEVVGSRDAHELARLAGARRRRESEHAPELGAAVGADDAGALRAGRGELALALGGLELGQVAQAPVADDGSEHAPILASWGHPVNS